MTGRRRGKQTGGALACDTEHTITAYRERGEERVRGEVANCGKERKGRGGGGGRRKRVGDLP